jgi:thiamine-phosphate pyrophosphorylase
MKVVFVTPDEADEKRLLKLVEEALEGGVDAVQLRLKGASARDLFPLAKLMREMTDLAGAALYVNDRADVALAAGAAGVHLAGNSLPVAAARAVLRPPFKIGVSCHGVAEAIQAQEEGADYVYLGTIFPSASKPGVKPAGLEELNRARRETRIPIIAIGGISAENVGSVLSAGADGVAVISAIAGRRSPREGAQGLVDAFNSWRGEKGPAVDVAG